MIYWGSLASVKSHGKYFALYEGVLGFVTDVEKANVPGVGSSLVESFGESGRCGPNRGVEVAAQVSDVQDHFDEST